MRMPESRLELVARVVLVGLAVAVVVVGFLLFGRPGDSGGASAGGAPGGSSATDPSATDEAGDADRAVDAVRAVDVDPKFGSVFDGATSEAAAHRFGLSVTANGHAVRYQYAWRDDAGPGVRKTFSGMSVSRSVDVARPAAIVWVQLGPDGGPASCRATVDGETTMTQTITKPFAVAFCVA